MSEELVYETAEVVTPQTGELETVEVDAADPQESVEAEETTSVGTDATEVTEPKQGTDAWYAKNRREKEAAERTLAERTAEIEAIKRQNEELLTYRQQREAQEQEAYLRQFAEDNGLDYEDVVASVAEEQEKEELMAKLQAKETREAELLAQIEALTSERQLGDLYEEDKEYFRSLETPVNTKELGDEFYLLRMNGVPTDIAYEAYKAKQAKVEIAPKAGKVGTEPAKNTGEISSAEWDGMSSNEQQRLIETDYDRVYRSQLKWLDE